jgi:alkanesulfonate monooxygenase SsuD/methylene tetrahydromethanopterin reductase-like flavin-dependent oxidoreductase (luciferase family)
MRFGLFLPPFDEFADPGRVMDLAVAAEEAGWHGLFIWDHMLAGAERPVADPWVTLAGIAAATRTIRLGAMVTPLARRRPWVLARQIASLDRLSKGRLTVGIGLGDDGWHEFSSFGEVTDAAPRARLLDESLTLLQKLLLGKPVEHRGEAYTVSSPAFLPLPVQQPLPMWAAGRWPNRRPLARAARLQGFFPIFAGGNRSGSPDPRQLSEIRQLLSDRGAPAEFDVAVTWALSLEPPDRLAAAVAELGEAGVTWALETFSPSNPPAPVVEEIVRRGPPFRG